jgi:hypothetical protein
MDKMLDNSVTRLVVNSGQVATLQPAQYGAFSSFTFVNPDATPINQPYVVVRRGDDVITI